MKCETIKVPLPYILTPLISITKFKWELPTQKVNWMLFDTVIPTVITFREDTLPMTRTDDSKNNITVFMITNCNTIYTLQPHGVFLLGPNGNGAYKASQQGFTIRILKQQILQLK